MPLERDLPQIINTFLELKEKGICHFTDRSEQPFSELCSFRVGGPIAYTIAPLDKKSLCLVLGVLRQGKLPYCVLGGGSNILPPDEGYRGVVVLTTHLARMQCSGERIYASCGAPLNACVLLSAKNGLSGMEGLYGIPATVGGAVYMNAGANGYTVSDCLESVELYDADTDTVLSLSRQDMGFSYRESILQGRKNLTVLSAVFRLFRGDESKILQSVREYTKKRLATQPLQYPSAGSAFKRPRLDIEVWQLVDRCGLRGYACGGAQISEKHAGFIINRGGATAQNICDIMSYVRREVLHTTGILLIPEIEILKNRE